MNTLATATPPAITDAFAALVDFTVSHQEEIERYIRERFSGTQPFFYNSVDVRNSGFKLAPVDTNLFPGGFNNLTQDEREHAATLVKKFLDTHYKDVRHVVILAENHTRNRFYLENVRILADIIRAAGRMVYITSPAACESGQVTQGVAVSGETLTFEPFTVQGTDWYSLRGDIEADLVLINNDLSSGLPAMLDSLSVPVTPPPGFGWYRRRKSHHFDAYSTVIRDFCNHFDLDPWLMSAYYRKCPEVDFFNQRGIDCIAVNADRLLYKIRAKYEEYGIDAEPNVFVKADNGTYGMGIMTVRSGEELHNLSRTIRKKMHVAKEGQAITQVIIQEGVPTVDTHTGDNGAAYSAEPMMYLIGGQVSGRILRYNTERGTSDNLNSKGMGFAPITKKCPLVDLAARLAAYASSWECYAENYTI